LGNYKIIYVPDKKNIDQRNSAKSADKKKYIRELRRFPQIFLILISENPRNQRTKKIFVET